jgi:biopolymer transport protein ExbD
MARKREYKVKKTELILTPLIDCVLFLMTFLLLVTDFARQDDFEFIKLPDLDTAKPVENPDPQRLVIMIDQKGAMYISGARRTDEEVREALFSEARRSREAGTQLSHRLVTVGADEKAPWEPVQKIITWCTDRHIKIWRLAFAILPVEKRETPPLPAAKGAPASTPGRT